MDLAFVSQQLKRPPEEVRLRLLYPELPNPIPFADACAHGPWNDYDQHPPELRGCYYIYFPFLPGNESYAVTEQHHRIVEEYEEAQERQGEAERVCAAARWERRPGSEPPEPAPEEIPRGGQLTPRQELFCEHYAAQPVGTRAAILAGYSEENAAPYGSRLIKNPLVLDRIAQLRAERGIHYVVERDTLHDKLEAVFFEALGDRNQAAAVAALRLQAVLAGMVGRPASSESAGGDEKAKESQGGSAKKPTKAKVAAREKPRKAKVGSRKKPRKAKQSQ